MGEADAKVVQYGLIAEEVADDPAFVAAALERRKRLRESIGKLAQAIEKARDEVPA